ncbi:hypothetical protein BCR44DRAFT_172105 [Catenaria anguillulae PL171]|uniref:Uncharacterized protein n=1 Tax=Catenaria anguillulae PL171 TaxID=765915 RepID=A0A1Y2HMR7_9FUNG|nr:hypothetical protein BCR44DRAFT_172105 [Catenaria anguillulae PL171]
MSCDLLCAPWQLVVAEIVLADAGDTAFSFECMSDILVRLARCVNQLGPQASRWPQFTSHNCNASMPTPPPVPRPQKHSRSPQQLPSRPLALSVRPCVPLHLATRCRSADLFTGPLDRPRSPTAAPAHCHDANNFGRVTGTAVWNPIHSTLQSPPFPSWHQLQFDRARAAAKLDRFLARFAQNKSPQSDNRVYSGRAWIPMVSRSPATSHVSCVLPCLAACVQSLRPLGSPTLFNAPALSTASVTTRFRSHRRSIRPTPQVPTAKTGRVTQHRVNHGAFWCDRTANYHLLLILSTCRSPMLSGLFRQARSSSDCTGISRRRWCWIV